MGYGEIVLTRQDSADKYIEFLLHFVRFSIRQRSRRGANFRSTFIICIKELKKNWKAHLRFFYVKISMILFTWFQIYKFSIVKILKSKHSHEKNSKLQYTNSIMPIPTMPSTDDEIQSLISANNNELWNKIQIIPKKLPLELIRPHTISSSSPLTSFQHHLTISRCAL